MFNRDRFIYPMSIGQAFKMATKDEIQLAWSDFQIDATQSFQRLRTNQDFWDITLVSEEYHLIKAHRVILSAGSSFFRTVLTSLEANPHPMFYLKGLSSFDISCMLDFIYCGETKVPKNIWKVFSEPPQILESWAYTLQMSLLNT